MKKAISILLVLVLAPVCVYLGLDAWSYLQGQDLRTKQEGVETVYLFKFPSDRTVLIRDKFSRIERSWGGSSDSVLTSDGIRTVIFTGPAILKSSVDSIEPQENYVKVKGHMGVYTDDLNFTVDEDGIISSDNWHGG